MLEHYKTIYEGGEGELVEKKIPFHRNRPSCGNRRRGPCLYRRNEKKNTGMHVITAMYIP